MGTPHGERGNMITEIRRLGNSAGVVIPAMMLKEVQVEVGTKVELKLENGTFTIKPIVKSRGKHELDLAWLLEDYRDLDPLITGPRFGAEENIDEHSS